MQRMWTFFIIWTKTLIFVHKMFKNRLAFFFWILDEERRSLGYGVKSESIFKPSVLELVKINKSINFFDFFEFWPCWRVMVEGFEGIGSRKQANTQNQRLWVSKNLYATSFFPFSRIWSKLWASVSPCDLQIPFWKSVGWKERKSVSHVNVFRF